MGPGLSAPVPPDWAELHVDVVGLGVAGFACADALMQRGAIVTILDSEDGDRQRARANILDILGARIRLGSQPQLSADAQLVVLSPGVRPAAPIILKALAQEVPVWGELELAWWLRAADPAPWLFVSGTNGKTTATLMLESMLVAAGKRTAAVGNIGVSLVEAVASGVDFDVLAVEVGAPQLPFVYSASPLASVCLNLAPDHVDHFGSFAAYAAAKARVYSRTQVACVYNVEDPATEQMVIDAEVIEGCRAIGFTLGAPSVSMLGVADGVLVDRAFISNRNTHGQELASVADIRPTAPHNISNALAAAALARAYGVPSGAVREGLRNFVPAGHRIADVATVNGVRYVDDSKATNCHAAATSIRAFDSVVWVAGGLAKGQEFDELVVDSATRLVGVVLLGREREVIRQALARHAPNVPVEEVAATDTGAMADVVRLATQMAKPGDTVLLAPGCASWDMFRDYAARGEAFAHAVRALDGV